MPAVAVIFVFLHSGARADGLCEREFFVRSGELSLWPPGARCTYGEPAIERILVSRVFFIAAATVVLASGFVWLSPRP